MSTEMTPLVPSGEEKAKPTQTPMNSEIKKAWCEALRGGAYRQGRFSLRRKDPNGDTFCCLGVLCNIMAPDAWTTRPHILELCHLGSSDYPSPQIFVAAGLQNIYEIVVKNDDKQMSFNQIADYIEETY